MELVNNGRKSRRKVNCLREPRDQIDMCPLCKAGVNSRNTFLIEMLQYITDPQTGAVTVKPVVWERSMSYANRLKSLIDEYGPLDDCILRLSVVVQLVVWIQHMRFSMVILRCIRIMYL